ncbi:MAG: hypothetical protein PHI18_00360 [bacterium]|nr:hypothetical protein [bacterium]
MKRVLLVLMLGVVVAAAPSLRAADAPDAMTDAKAISENAPTQADVGSDARESEEISTEMQGLDSLDVLPTEMITSFGGGTRRISLESTVFRRQEPVRYEPSGRRDPFRPLIRDDKGDEEVKTDLLLYQGAVLTGVVWSEGEYLAMIRDKDGQTFFLREEDPIYQGRVVSVTNSMVTLEVWEFGDYERVTLNITGDRASDTN